MNTYFSLKTLLITDNFNLDTSRLSMNLFAKADLFIVQHKYREAEQLYDSINELNAYHTLNDDILFRKAKIAIGNSVQPNIIFLQLFLIK